MAVGEDLGFVGAVDSYEIVLIGGIGGDAELAGEGGDAAAAVAAHGALAAIGVEIDHAEVVAFGVLEEHEAVGADAEAAVAELLDLGVGKVEKALAVVD